MPIDIEGWVEVCQDPRDKDEQWSWFAAISLDRLVFSNDEFSDAVFGIAKFRTTDQPLAYRRGLPPNPSSQVTRDRERIDLFLPQIQDWEFFGYSYIGYDEILATDLTAYGIRNLRDTEWALVFAMIEQMRSTERFSTALFRIVCWAFR